jgi:NifU-like protein involved in Fe-S cluster formation
LATSVTTPLYTREILRLAASIPFLEPIEKVDGYAEKRSPTCGSRVSVSVRMAGNRVSALSQSVEACAFGQASAALMGAGALGLNEAEVRQAIAGIELWLSGDDAASWPGIEALAAARARKGRHGAILLPFVTLLAALEDVR